MLLFLSLPVLFLSLLFSPKGKQNEKPQSWVQKEGKIKEKITKKNQKGIVFFFFFPAFEKEAVEGDAVKWQN